MSDTGAPPKKKFKRRCVALRDLNAPKAPRNAYVFYLASKRKGIEKENKGLRPGEINILLARAWRELSDEDKQPFIDLAIAERARYNKEMEEYRKSDNFKEFQAKKNELIKTQKVKKDEVRNDSEEPGTSHSNNLSKGGDTACLASDDVPIFSTQFLEFNKMREANLKQIRCEINSLEEEKKNLKTRIERLEINVDMLNAEIEEDMLDENVSDLKAKWSKLIVEALEKIQINGEDITLKNIEDIMKRINQMLEENPKNELLCSISSALADVDFS